MTENKKSIRVIIYGAGAVGSILGGNLARTGNDVILIGRPGHVNAIREHGLQLVAPSGTNIVQLPAVTTPDQIDFGPNDTVLLCVKSQDTDEALRELKTVVEDVPIFCFQNGVRNEEIATRYFPRVYGVTVRIGGVFITNGEVSIQHEPAGSPIMGRYPTGTDEVVEAVAANLRTAGFLVLVTPDIMPYKWGQLLRNLNNGVVAITNAAGDDSRRIAEAARQEAQEVLAQAGIRWISGEEIARQWPESTTIHFSEGTHVRSSTWQSLARQVGTVETDFFNGEIVRLAEQLGKQAPVNEVLWRITQEMAAKREKPGKYTPAELCRLVGLD